jgi:hypothetical protein
MGLAEITSEGVEKAIAEFDELGRDEFLQKHGFGKDKDRFLVRNGKRYDLNAIIGVVHGHSEEDREPLTSDDFSVFGKLGFTLRLFSWEVLSRTVAKKRTDKSSFLHSGTSVPRDMIWFFENSERGPRFLEPSLVFNEKPFEARIDVDEISRYRLFSKPFASALGHAFPDSLSAYENGLLPTHDVWIHFERVSATRYEVECLSRQCQYFAFLTNPNRYRIEDAIRECEVDAWPTGGTNMQLGDRVIIWKAKGRGEERGIVALGQVVGKPELRTDADNPYWVDPPSDSELKERVNVRYEVPEGLPLWLGGAHDDVLESLSVGRAHGGTVFNVTPEQWSAVVAVIGGEKTPCWQEPEDDLQPVRRRSQGRGLSPGKRKAIEEWAVERAIKLFPELSLLDVGNTKSWDLEDDTTVGSSPPIRIEVKGSTLRLDKVTLTDNEVEHARKARDEKVCRLILVVVEKIKLVPGDGKDEWNASGGEVRVFDPWPIDEDRLEPTQWRYRL